jgi:hypothetical protein
VVRGEGIPVLECDFADLDEASVVTSGKSYRVSGMLVPLAEGNRLQLKYASLMGG